MSHTQSISNTTTETKTSGNHSGSLQQGVYRQRKNGWAGVEPGELTFYFIHFYLTWILKASTCSF